jgi:Na+/H+ antiporter NhaD/arsenite permease-like protein
LETTALIIFIVTYLGIIFTRLPGINVDRPSAAFFGAVLMALFRVISLQDAVAAIDFNTIALLLGMMIIISALELDGFFTFISSKTTALSKNPRQLLFITIFVTGFASAFLVNDAVVLLFTPVIIKICRSKKLNPVSFLIGEIMSSNTGSVMTITGNPQNILIGLKSGIPYGIFLLRMLPVSLAGMVVIYYVILLLYKKQIPEKFISSDENNGYEYNFSSMKYSVPIFIFVVIAFFLSHEINISYPLIALGGASLVLIFGKVKPSRVIKEVDWVLLLFFASLFIVVHAFEKAGPLNTLISNFHLSKGFGGIISLHIISLALSQIVSNVPYTVLMIPLLSGMNDNVIWLTLASASTLAGNLTIIGAMANLIVIEIAKGYKIEIRFFEFFRAGIIVTALTFAVSVVLLSFY